jgi:hypothetical protein
MTFVIFVIALGIGWLLVLAYAINDATIFIRGRIDDDTNVTGIPTDELPALAKRPGFVRLVAGLRLLFAVAWLIGVPAFVAIRAWFA